MATLDISGFDNAPIMKIDNTDIRREITKKCLQAAGKVMEKELKRTIEAKHHVVSHDMANAVAQTKVYENIDGGYIEVYPQGTDSRGVSNSMKHTIINKGAYNKESGRRWKRDRYQAEAEKKAQAFIQTVMETQLQVSLRELGLTD